MERQGAGGVLQTYKMREGMLFGFIATNPPSIHSESSSDIGIHLQQSMNAPIGQLNSSTTLAEHIQIEDIIIIETPAALSPLAHLSTSPSQLLTICNLADCGTTVNALPSQWTDYPATEETLPNHPSDVRPLINMDPAIIDLHQTIFTTEDWSDQGPSLPLPPTNSVADA
jgi:hypothetical protein